MRPQQDAVDAHWPRDVLYLLLAHVLESEVELVAHLITHDPADADSARLGQGFGWLVAAGLIVVTMLTVEVSSHRSAHGHVGGESAAPAGFEVLQAGFRRILGFIRNVGNRPRPITHCTLKRTAG